MAERERRSAEQTTLRRKTSSHPATVNPNSMARKMTISTTLTRNSVKASTNSWLILLHSDPIASLRFTVMVQAAIGVYLAPPVILCQGQNDTYGHEHARRWHVGVLEHSSSYSQYSPCRHAYGAQGLPNLQYFQSQILA